jgi:Dihydroorotate dehydrogenase
MAVHLTWQVARTVKIPVVGMGGIVSARDALEFLLVGASAIQVGTANFVHPRAAADLVSGLSEWLGSRGIGSVREIVGTMRHEGGATR